MFTKVCQNHIYCIYHKLLIGGDIIRDGVEVLPTGNDDDEDANAAAADDDDDDDDD